MATRAAQDQDVGEEDEGDEEESDEEEVDEEEEYEEEETIFETDLTVSPSSSMDNDPRTAHVVSM